MDEKQDKNFLIKRVRPNVENIPEEWKKLNQWICWKLDIGKGGKLAKVLYNSRTGFRAKSNDPKTWGSFERALAAFDKDPSYLGIGFVVSADDDYCGIDLDYCRNPETEELTQEAKEIKEQFDSYTEVTVSTVGIRVLIKGKLPKNIDHEAGNFEVYDTVRFFTVTGNVLDGKLIIEDRQEKLDWFLQKYFPKTKTKPWQADSFKHKTRNILIFKYACSLRAKSVPFEKAKELVLAKARASEQTPPFTDEEAEDCLKSAYKYPEGVPIPDYVLELNQEYFVTQMKGKTFVCWEDYDDETEEYSLETSSFGDFSSFYSNQKVTIGEKQHGIGDLWLHSKYRRQYKKIVFRPDGNTPEGCYNLWKGFFVKPAPGDWSLYEKHLRDIVCQGNKEHYQYLIHWMAYAVQHPEKQGWVAVVMIGERGSGKGATVQIFGRIFKPHFKHIYSSYHFIGHFNPHLRDCVLLFCDEAYWAGDKKAEGVLKGQITEKKLVIEEKGKNLEHPLNRLHVMIATNHAWAIPAGAQERRFFVLNISSDKIENKKYFDDLFNQMEKEGGTEALLYDLQKMDLSNFNVKNAPNTQALDDQKVFSMNMDPVTAYWYERLINGTMPFWDQNPLTSVKHYEYREIWSPVVVEDFYEDYVRKTGKSGRQDRGEQTSLGIKLRRLLPNKYLKDTKVTNISGIRQNAWEFPLLKKCRDHFKKLMKMKVPWEKEKVLIKS